MINIFQTIPGLILFLLSGILLSYIIFPKINIIKRAVYSIVLTISISTIIGILLYLINKLSSINVFFAFTSIILLFVLIILKSNKKYKTNFNKDIWYLLFFSLIGTFWKLWFLKSIKNFGDAYTYTGQFAKGNVPNLGFYTGIATDHSNYIGSKITNQIIEFLYIDKIINNQFISIFLITFIFLGFIYIIFNKYRNKKFAYLGVALMALGPIEIFYTTLSLIGHPLSYICLFSLFLLFDSEDNKIFWLALLLAITIMFTYYTASIIIILASLGFIIALVIKEVIKTKNLKKTLRNSLKNKKIWAFLIILTIIIVYIFLLPQIKDYSINQSQKISDIQYGNLPENLPSTAYKDSTFLGLSAIRWQMVFFSLCGLSFIFYLRKKDFSEKNLNLLLCLIPVLLVSYGFFHVSFPTRIFDYFAFFGLLALKIPKKYFKIFFILSFIFILITSFYVAQDKKIFLKTSDKEIKGAKEIAGSFNGKIFSDQTFINQLILNKYYNVTGADEKDLLTYNLFYQDNPSVFLDAIQFLNKNLSVGYIAITKRMQEQYILMLNYPQKPLTNIQLYEDNLLKVYDNNEIKIYETKFKSYNETN